MMPAMIARLHSEPRARRPSTARFLVPALLAWLLIGAAQAEPSDAPDAPATPLTAPTPTSPDAAAPVFDPDFDPGFGGFEPTPGGFNPDTAVAAPVAPELKAPAIDAYLDIAALNADLGALGFDQDSTGFRLLAGFQFKDVGAGRWGLASEIGLLDFGSGMRNDVTSVLESGYIKTTTNHITNDVSSLSLGTKITWTSRAVSPYLRAGIHAYHQHQRAQTRYTYIPLGPQPPIPPTTLQPQTVTDVGLNLWGLLGLEMKLGNSYSLYAEYGLFNLDDGAMNVGMAGIIWNF